MRRLPKILAVGLALVMIASGGVASAQGATTNVGPGWDIFGNFRNFYSNKCLDVRAQDGYYNRGARVQQYHCTGAAEQQWAAHYIRFDDQLGKLLVQFKVKRSGMCLQPFPLLFHEFDDGLVLMQQPCDGSNPMQLWYVAGTAVNFTDMWANYHTGKCIDVEGASTADGAWVQQYTCNATEAQGFRTRLFTLNP